MSKTLQPEALIDALNWRCATKKFDATKKIPEEQWHALEEALRLSPSSFGLQPWKFIVVQAPALREKIRAVAWNQTQVTDASHLVVLAHKKNLGIKEIDAFIKEAAVARGVTIEALAAYREMMVGMLVKGPIQASIDAWAAKQVYIALGVLLTSSALLGIDACPMEGFSHPDVDKILELEKQGLCSVVMCTLGYRATDDKYAQFPKVRYQKSLVFQQV